MNYNKYNHGQWGNHNHNWNRNNPGGRIVFGIVVALVGIYFLLRALGILHICFHSLWPVILIAVGAMMGAKNNFRNNAWWILIAVGVAYLIPEFKIFNASSSDLFWPLIIIGVGIMVILRPNRRCKKSNIPDTVGGAVISSEDKLFIDVTFGGRKELITSKDFKGGMVSVSFGGAELNLTQADFTSPSITIDCHISFGALELIVPGNWDIQNEIRPSFGSVEDERVMHAPIAGEVRKKLLLTGTCSCSSIEIKSY